jgi:hypothetical protein
MKWTSTDISKPKSWEVVTIRCVNALGDISEMPGYWTGQLWRVVGDKTNLKGLTVTSWTSEKTDYLL